MKIVTRKLLGTNPRVKWASGSVVSGSRLCFWGWWFYWLRQVAAKVGADWMKISASKSEGIVLRWKEGSVRNELLPQRDVFWVLLCEWSKRLKSKASLLGNGHKPSVVIERMRWWIKAREMRFCPRVSGLSLGDGMRNSGRGKEAAH